ncbi:MAG: cob(I)yrinic acid a,c-diamide adenosyltransferase [Thermoprotei archaeon]
MKNYTRSGDSGKTSLYGGSRVSKTDLRVEAYGGVDELNSLLGVVRSQVRHTWISEMIKKEQVRLFKVGADLATPLDAKAVKQPPRLTKQDLDDLEAEIDSVEIKPVDKFVIPGASLGSAYLHFARAVCRRVERSVWVLMEHDRSVNTFVAVYLNRLSSLLYVLARRAAELDSAEEDLWLAD